MVSRYKCPCCDYYTYPVPTKEAVGFICPVCFWENEPSDCNHGLTILEGRSNYKKYEIWCL
ncbi:CPCC family cysteine-rich protein [Lacrimispora sp.]|uniref:CPCC family cysteine-rich protein n=1 Tax=Lacrimispora sp. TaxID=2719234 RepID=UPI00286327F3|nr:CPCC family cysteine-rich protein [Lacrimispora sp.]MDR7813872.1 CPCC family cysteine-rich protein [Lacrimispora sp.]